MRWNHIGGHCAVLSCSLLARPAYADFTSINPPPPDELSQAGILSLLYGGTFAPSGSVDFSNGAIRAQRVHDFTLQGGSPAMNMSSSPTGGFDEVWLPNFDHATATLRVASFADFGQRFGYFEGDGLTEMLRPLFTLPPNFNNYFPNQAIAMPLFPDNTTIRFGRDGGMPPRSLSSKMATNPGGKDHMVTFEIVTAGVGPGAPRKWVLFWEDLLFDKPILDDDFNDLAVEIIADTLDGERWTRTGSGAWEDGGNWASGAFPNGDDKIARFDDVITGDATVTLNGPIVVNGVRLNSTYHRYTFDGNTLNLGGQGVASPHVAVEQGNHTFRNTVHIANAPIPDGFTTGVATLSVSRTADVLRFAGNLTVNPNLPLTVYKSGQGEVELKRLRSVATLNLVVDRGTLRFAADGGTSKLNDVFLFASTQLDIGNNALVVDYSSDSPLQTLRGLILSGFNGGAWDGDGIISSAAGANNTYGVGYGPNDGSANGVNFTSFGVPGDLIPVDVSAVLIRYTRLGDTNLDGTVNLQDFNRLAANFGLTGGALWSQGDFNYDGNVNLQDFNRLAGQFGLSAGADGVVGAEDWAALFGAVPEPSLPALAGVALLAGRLARRRGTSRR
jgi:hypothetical protein